ncbi:hypothetical protein CDAR_66951 [Caerostris darwini]|uniref:Uncharacterized protein n=1 Tax=Caerostris darwini TaxID=1538125 RepID=A0AAV4QY89_9ARAC|nr:hypothetical protein CDAR_66951 [Caerostris darwini]
MWWICNHQRGCGGKKIEKKKKTVFLSRTPAIISKHRKPRPSANESPRNFRRLYTGKMPDYHLTKSSDILSSINTHHPNKLLPRVLFARQAMLHYSAQSATQDIVDVKKQQQNTARKRSLQEI